MKKLLLILMCILLALTPGTLAESLPASGSDFMQMTLDGESLSLLFDPSPYYSTWQDRFVQAYFYVQTEDRLVQMYVSFPDSVQSGDVISTQSAAESGDGQSGLILWITDSSGMVYSIATQTGEGAYPAGSSYSITFTDVRQENGTLIVSGALEAAMVDVDAAFNPLSGTRTLSASFSFTLTADVSAESPEPNAPSVAPTAPTFLVTPADAQKI